MTYRLDLPTIMLAFKDDHQTAVTIQADAFVDVIGPAEDSRFVVVNVNGEQFQVFASDLDNHGKQIRGAAMEVSTG
jgi:hypothetical protein